MHEFFKGMIGKAGEGVASFVASGLSGGLSDAEAWASGIARTFNLKTAVKLTTEPTKCTKLKKGYVLVKC